MANDGGLWAWAARRLGIPRWGQVLILALVSVCGSAAYVLWAGYGKLSLADDQVAKQFAAINLQLNSVRESIRVLAEHTPDKDLVKEMLSEAKLEQESKMSQKLLPIQKHLERVDASQQDLKKNIAQQAAITRIDNPYQVLAIIRVEIDVAKKSGKTFPAVQMVDYKNAILALPQSTVGYWETAEMVVNYESFLLQSIGVVPDPTKVSRPCRGITNDKNFFSQHNTFIGPIVISNCIVDLDTQVYDGVIFKNCVVRSRGGTFVLRRVTFVNCRFVLSLPERPKRPTEQKLLLAIISAPKQTNVFVAAG